MAVRAAPGHIGLTQEIIDHLGGATGSLGYLWSRYAILVSFDDFFVAQGQPFAFAGAAFATLAHCLPSRTNDGQHRGTATSRGNPDRFRIETLTVKLYNLSIAEDSATSFL
jgi:hypothetical protein